MESLNQDETRLFHLIRESIDRCHLDLSGSLVLTEAASGAYVVTPLIAALAGADPVYAITKTSPYGTYDEIRETTMKLASHLGVDNRIKIIKELSREIVEKADIITNSGHVRPIDKKVASWMKPSAVVPLMYEAWELRDKDLDLQALRERNIKVAGTNEQHPSVDVFSYLGPMAVQLLQEAEITVFGSHILLLCNNPFGPYIQSGLIENEATVTTMENWDRTKLPDRIDAVVLAMTPSPDSVLNRSGLSLLKSRFPDILLALFWGTLDKKTAHDVGIRVTPSKQLLPGHMGILPSDLGPEPVIRLQTAGLKVGELLRRGETLFENTLLVQKI
jgi:hypothetical protein